MLSRVGWAKEARRFSKISGPGSVDQGLGSWVAGAYEDDEQQQQTRAHRGEEGKSQGRDCTVMRRRRVGGRARGEQSG